MRPEFGTLEPCKSGHGGMHVSSQHYSGEMGDRQESLEVFWPDSLAYYVVQVGF